MPYVKGRDGKPRTINNPLEGSVGDIDLNAITTVTLSASGNVTGNYIIGNGTTVVGITTSQLNNDAGFITASTANVISVNGQTGVVSLSIPTATSNLTNDSGYITSATANVISVNGQTGAVTISTGGNVTAANVSYTPAVANDWSWTASTPNDAAEGLDDLAETVKDILSGTAVFSISGPFSNDAQAAAGGVPVGGIYYNASGGLVIRQT